MRRLKEYWITLTFTVEAEDEDEALAIARALLKAADSGTLYRVEGEVSQIVEA